LGESGGGEAGSTDVFNSERASSAIYIFGKKIIRFPPQLYIN